MELTKEGLEETKREDYLGLVQAVVGHLYSTITKDSVHVKLVSPEGKILAEQIFEIDVIKQLEEDGSFNIGSPELVTKLYQRNIPSLTKLGKSPFYIPDKDRTIARFFDWLYKLFTKEKI